MIKELKNSFMQAAFGSTVWVSILATLYNSQRSVPFVFIWHIIGIGSLLGFVFGVVYPYLWNYSTFKAYKNIIFSTLISFLCMFSCVYLFSAKMFDLVKPYAVGILILTFVGHTLGFYFYSKNENRKMAKKLNNIV